MPAVTVLMPIYNAERYLALAIESILAQTFTDFELLLIDDGSTDGSYAVAESFRDPRIRLVRNERNLGLTPTLNRGLELAHAPLIARLDADDSALPQRFERQVEYLSSHSDVALLGSRGYIVDAEGVIFNLHDVPTDSAAIRWVFCFENSFLHSAVIFRRQAALEVGGYPEGCEDFDLWSRIARRHAVANLPDRLVRWRAHHTSMTSTIRADRAAAQHAVALRNLREAFLPGPFSDAELERAADFAFLADPARVEGFIAERARVDAVLLDLFERLAAEFRWRHPDVRRSQPFADTVAWQYLLLARRIGLHTPVLFGRALRSAVQISPIAVARQAARIGVGRLWYRILRRGRPLP